MLRWVPQKRGHPSDLHLRLNRTKPVWKPMIYEIQRTTVAMLRSFQNPTAVPQYIKETGNVLAECHLWSLTIWYLSTAAQSLGKEHSTPCHRKKATDRPFEVADGGVHAYVGSYGIDNKIHFARSIHDL